MPVCVCGLGGVCVCEKDRSAETRPVLCMHPCWAWDSQQSTFEGPPARLVRQGHVICVLYHLLSCLLLALNRVRVHGIARHGARKQPSQGKQHGRQVSRQIGVALADLLQKLWRELALPSWEKETGVTNRIPQLLLATWASHRAVRAQNQFVPTLA